MKLGLIEYLHYLNSSSYLGHLKKQKHIDNIEFLRNEEISNALTFDFRSL